MWSLRSESEQRVNRMPAMRDATPEPVKAKHVIPSSHPHGARHPVFCVGTTRLMKRHAVRASTSYPLVEGQAPPLPALGAGEQVDLTLDGRERVEALPHALRT